MFYNSHATPVRRVTPTLLTARQDRTMMGKAMYNPTSKASVLPPPAVVPLSLPNFPSNPFIPGAESPGTTPPSVEARISSSVASHDFIFSARLADDGDFDDDDDDEVSPSPFPSADARSGKENAPPLPSSTTDTMEDGVRWRRGVECDDDDDDGDHDDDHDDGGEKASDASAMAAAMRRRRQRGIVEFYSVLQRVAITELLLQRWW